MSESKDLDDDLLAYLAENNCELYCPYPLDFYEGKEDYTIAGHPIDKDIEGEGYKTCDNVTYTYMVDEDYAGNDPILIIMPVAPGGNGANDGTSGGGGGGGNGGGGGTGDPIYQVRINWFRCSNLCGGIFEGDLDMNIKRVAARAIADQPGEYEAYEPVHITFVYERAYARCAYENWAKWNNGWKETNIVWDTDWKTDEHRQGIVIWERDPALSFSRVKVSASYKSYTGTFEVERNVEYKGDFLGKNDEWWRTWFFTTSQFPDELDELYKGRIVRTTGGDTKFTMPITRYN